MKLAERIKRFAAFLLDLLLIYLVVFGPLNLFFNFDEILKQYPDFIIYLKPKSIYISIKMSFIKFIIWMTYCAIMEASVYQGTFGKIEMGIKVVDETGKRMTPRKSIIRNISKIFTNILLPFGFFWMLNDDKNQGLHDKISGTFVVRKMD